MVGRYDSTLPSPVSRKHHPVVQSGQTLFAAPTGSESHRIGHLLHDVPQANFVVNKKAGKAHAVWVRRYLLCRLRWRWFNCTCRGVALPLHTVGPWIVGCGSMTRSRVRARL